MCKYQYESLTEMAMIEQLKFLFRIPSFYFALVISALMNILSSVTQHAGKSFDVVTWMPYALLTLIAIVASIVVMCFIFKNIYEYVVGKSITAWNIFGLIIVAVLKLLFPIIVATVLYSVVLFAILKFDPKGIAIYPMMVVLILVVYAGLLGALVQGNAKNLYRNIFLVLKNHFLPLFAFCLVIVFISALLSIMQRTFPHGHTSPLMLVDIIISVVNVVIGYWGMIIISRDIQEQNSLTPVTGQKGPDHEGEEEGEEE